jgi:hypothetical protein
MYLCNASPRPPNSVVHLPVGTKDYKNIQTGVFKIIDNFLLLFIPLPRIISAEKKMPYGRK